MQIARTLRRWGHGYDKKALERDQIHDTLKDALGTVKNLDSNEFGALRYTKHRPPSGATFPSIQYRIPQSRGQGGSRNVSSMTVVIGGTWNTKRRSPDSTTSEIGLCSKSLVWVDPDVAFYLTCPV